MHSSLQIVIILTIGFTLASFFSYLMQKLNLPSILGYLFAGYLIGPYSPGFVANAQTAEQLAEVGVVLMLFSVGLHFKIEDLLKVKHIAIPGAILQTFAAALSAALIIRYAGWSWSAGIIMGFAIGVASTVVLVRALTENGLLKTEKGHIAVGWLVVEDIFTVVVLILLPLFVTFSSEKDFSFIHVGSTFLFVLVKFFLLAIVMFKWGYKIVDTILKAVTGLRSQELFTLTLIALTFLIATGSALLFSTSIALGAFIAGMVIGKTGLKHQAEVDALPLKNLFTVVFFLSVGMLFNPTVIVSQFSLFIAILSVILIIKPLVAYLFAIMRGLSWSVALTIAISLAQIGEFSFILAEEAMNLDLFPDEGFDILVACAIVSISLNAFLFQGVRFIEKRQFF